jgi:chemotaxis protein methyltransferase CheR
MKSRLSPREFNLLQRFIEERSGILLGEEKAYLIESRLADILENEHLSSYEELFYRVSAEPEASFAGRVIDAVTTNETFWFRDKTPWIILAEVLIPVYVKEMQEGKRKDVHIWSCACSSGQEPYSIAMCIDSYLMDKGIKNIQPDQFHITATDLSGEMVSMAMDGQYDCVSMERGLDEKTRLKYFTRRGNLWVIDDNIRNMVAYSQFNLKSSSFYFRNYDIIFCRNVLIYFSERLRAEIMEKLARSLKPQGVLFVGAAEIVTDSNKYFAMETYREGVYFKLKE